MHKPTHAMSPTLPSSVVAALSYLAPTMQRPISYAYEPPPGTPWENCAHDSHLVSITDARQRRAQLSVHHEGFELLDAPTQVRDFRDDEEVRTVYYQEAIELALAATGASRAYVFDHLLRRREEDRGSLSFGRRGASGLAAANGRIHNDYTEASGQKRLGLVLTELDATERVNRFAIVNIWRSIKGPILDTPLAVCDARTLSIQDFVVGEVRYPKREGEIYLFTHAEKHRWSYFSEMARDEALIFKQYDSQVSGVARFTPHAAFDHPEMPQDAPLRESIELRCLVVYE